MALLSAGGKTAVLNPNTGLTSVNGAKPKPKPKPKATTPALPSLGSLTNSATNFATSGLNLSAPSAFPIDNYSQQLNQQINDAYNNRRNSELASYNADRQNSLAQLNNQKKQVSYNYQQQRNQADVVNFQNAQRLREVMAANGLSKSGENVTASIALNNQRQGALNTLNAQEDQNIAQINQQINDVNNPQRRNAILDQIEADRSNALASALSQAQDQRWQAYQYNNMSAAQRAQLEQNEKQFGANMAWQLYSLQQNNALQGSMSQAQIDALSGFSGGKGGGVPNSYKKDLAQARSIAKIPDSQLPAFNYIIQHESSFNPNAKNPTSSAHGYAQFINGTAKTYEKKTGLSYSNPASQLVMAYQYMVDRYGSPKKAEAFWKKNGWY